MHLHRASVSTYSELATSAHMHAIMYDFDLNGSFLKNLQIVYVNNLPRTFVDAKTKG